MISRSNSNKFIVVVKLNYKSILSTIEIKFRLCTIQIQQFKLLQQFEYANFLLTSMVTLSKKIVKKESCKLFKYLQLKNSRMKFNENKKNITLFSYLSNDSKTIIICRAVKA